MLRIIKILWAKKWVGLFLLLVVIVTLVTIVCQNKLSTEKPLSSPGSDYILFQEEALPSILVRIEESGYVEFVEFDNGHKRILKYRSGKISEKKLGQLFGLIESKGFFEMKTSYAPRIKGEQLLLDSVKQTIYVRRNGKTKSVFVHEAGEKPVAPLGFTQIVDSVVEIASGQEDDPRYGTFVKAEKIEGFWNRLSALELRISGVKFNSFTEERLAMYPVLREAVLDPNKFIYVGTLDITKTKEFIVKEAYFSHFFASFKNNDFEVTVFERAK